MKKILLGMSGGVDSSVSAILLKDAGYEVYGVTMQLFEGGCCNLNSYLDAKLVCQQLGIKHFILDYKEEFKANVIDNFISEYSNCRTPNPCIECNKYLKFGELYKKAIELGIDYIATGHYANIEYNNYYKRNVLKKAKNINKDQSYVLYSIPKEVLNHIIFPLGNFDSKEQIREIARNHNLKVASKPDSEDICFIPDGNYKRFLEINSSIRPIEGNIVNTNGKILGIHHGLYNYTIGQRKGLGISHKEPLFVIGFNKEKNEVIVGEKSEIYKNEATISDINLLVFDELVEPIRVKVKTRYSTKEADATIEMMDSNHIKIKFDEPQARITPGQSAVFYKDDIVLGGGKIL